MTKTEGGKAPEYQASGKSNASIAAALLVFMVIVYSLVYSGVYTTDDEHILTSRAISLAFDGSPNLSRILGNSRVYQFSITDPLQAQQAENIEPLQGVIGSLLVRISVIFNLGRIQTLFLLNIWTTALTAMLIYLTARKKKYLNSVGVLLALLFGLCTIAFPYARTFFRDSLAMLFVACAWYFSAAFQEDETQKTLNGLGIIVSLLLGVLSKNTALIAAPVLLLEIVINHKKHSSANSRKTLFTWSLIGAVLIIAVSFWCFILPKIPLLARYSPAYFYSLLQFFFSTPHPFLTQALIGPFIAPGKSIYIFSPILILSLLSLIFHFKKSWSGYLYLILLVIAQALFYDDEWSAHINWGLRYVLPALPGLILVEAPVLDKMIRNRIWKFSLIGLAFISFLIQILGVLVPVNQYFSDCAISQPPITETEMIWSFHHSILLWSFRWITSGKPLNLAIGHNSQAALTMVGGILLAGILTFANLKRIKKKVLSSVSILVVMMLNLVMLNYYKNDSAYSITRKDLQGSQQEISSQFNTGDLILIKSYGAAVWEYWMNWTGPRLKWTSLPFTYPSPAAIKNYKASGDPLQAMDKITLGILEKEALPDRLVWLVLPSDTPGADLGIEENWLAQRSDEINCQVFLDDSLITRLCRYHLRK